jgi:hypothetical protein
MFSHLFYKGIYILDIEPELRVSIIMRGFISFAGIIMFYQSMLYLNLVTVAVSIMISSQLIAHFFFLKQERQQTLLVAGMSCSVISIILLFINMMDPGSTSKDAKIQYKKVNINYNHFWGFAYASVSGILLAVINYLNKKSSLIHYEELQQFYASSIAACFSPFFILKDISDNKQVTRYGQQELLCLAAISVLVVLKNIWFDRSLMTRMAV